VKIRFWKARKQSEDDLVRDADWQAKQAKLALRDGAMDHAIRWSNWTVPHTREILTGWRKEGRADRRVIELEEMQQEHGVHNPLLVPSVRVLLCELYAQAGDAAAARHHGQAIEAYQNEADTPNMVLADGFDHYGRGMHLIGDPAAAPALRRAVDLYRQHEVHLDGRHTIERFIQTVLLHHAETPEILPILHDAATWVRRLPPTFSPLRSSLLPPPQHYADRFTLMQIQQRMAEWLAVLDGPQLAEYYDRLGEFYPRGPDGPLFWSKIQQAVDDHRRQPDKTARRRRDPR
jgi:hypothetical protein